MTRAIILAAGQGTRLRPLTDDRPKGLVPLLGRSLIERQIETLRACGVTDIHIVAGYRAEMVEALGLGTTINPDFASTNMVASLFCARSAFPSEGDLVISYADIVYEAGNLTRLLASDAEVALMIDLEWRALWEQRLDDPLADAETLILDEEDNILELGEKPSGYEQIQGQYTGLIKVRGDRIPAMCEAHDRLVEESTTPQAAANMYMTAFLQHLIDTGWETRAVKVRGGWLEVDSVEDLRIYEHLAQSGQLARFYRPT